MKQGDLVMRKYYGGDVLFPIETIRMDYAILKGLDFRLLADAPLHDLSLITGPSTTSVAQKVRNRVNVTFYKMHHHIDQAMSTTTSELPSRTDPDQLYFEMPGKVLHLDGDSNYLRKSMQLYEAMKVPAEGFYVNESRMADVLGQ